MPWKVGEHPYKVVCEGLKKWDSEDTVTSVAKIMVTWFVFINTTVNKPIMGNEVLLQLSAY